MASILTVPNEILHEIVSQLLVPDQAALARTCKLLHAHLTPTVWKEVELHHRGVHEGLILWPLLERPSFIEDDSEFLGDCTVSDKYPFADSITQPSSRKYAQHELSETNRDAWHQKTPQREREWSNWRLRRGDSWESDGEGGRATDSCNRKTYQFGRERIFLGTKRHTSPSRWAELAAHVQSLCISIAIDQQVCIMLADLVNMRSLQLVGLPLEEEWDEGNHLRADAMPRPPIPAMMFPALRNLRLRGYIPTNLVSAILASNGSNITHLDLGLVAGPKEDALNSMLPSFPEDADQENDDEDEDDDGDMTDDEDKEPWGLHSPHWLQGETGLPTPLSSLTHLRLVKPYNGELPSGFCCDTFKDIPSDYDRVIYKEWAAVLDSAASTLKEAVFEHRVAMEVGDTVGDGDPHPQRKLRPSDAFHSSIDSADVQFCQIILRRFLTGGHAQFPNLQHLGLRGIRIREINAFGEELSRGGADTPHSEDVWWSNADRLRAAFPACDVELFEPAYPIYVYAGYIYDSWAMNRHEAGQDPGDGLLYDNSFYNDYRRRFGPDWRIGS